MKVRGSLVRTSAELRLAVQFEDFGVAQAQQSRRHVVGDTAWAQASSERVPEFVEGEVRYGSFPAGYGPTLEQVRNVRLA